MKKIIYLIIPALFMVLSSYADEQFKGNDLRIQKADVTPGNEVVLTIFKSASLDVTEIRILRSEEEYGPYERIGNISIEEQDVFLFTDVDATPEKNRYYYMLEATSDDGNASWMSQKISTIFLKATSLDKSNNEIVWNDYSGSYGFINTTYKLYRIVGGNTDPVPIYTATTGNVYFMDNIEQHALSGERIGYLLMAVINPDDLGSPGVMRSNVSVTTQRTRIYLPNAFSPKGRNNTYRPLSLSVNQSEYSFQVYNRWGQLIFETNNPSDGWNGMYKDDFVPPGVYVYFLRFRTAGSDEFQKNGTITVVY